MRKENNVSVLLHFNGRFFKGLSLGLVSNIKQKVLSTPQGTECCQAPQKMYTTRRKCGSCPLRSLHAGSGWGWADNSQSIRAAWGWLLCENNNKKWWGCGNAGTLVFCWRECKMVQLLQKTLRQVCKILNMKLPCVCMLSCFSPVWHSVTLWTVVPQPVYGILQARISQWVAISYSRGSSQPRDRIRISCDSCIGRRVLYHKHHWGRPHNPATALQGVYPKELKQGLKQIFYAHVPSSIIHNSWRQKKNQMSTYRRIS